MVMETQNITGRWMDVSTCSRVASRHIPAHTLAEMQIKFSHHHQVHTCRLYPARLCAFVLSSAQPSGFQTTLQLCGQCLHSQSTSRASRLYPRLLNCPSGCKLCHLCRQLMLQKVQCPHSASAVAAGRLTVLAFCLPWQ